MVEIYHVCVLSATGCSFLNTGAIIDAVMHHDSTSDHNKHKSRTRLEGVAPASIIREDFAAFDARVILRCSYDVEQLILIQSIEGHAHEGHGLFYGRKFPNTTIDDIAKALRLNPEMVKADRQELIDEIFDFARRAIAGERERIACNAEGRPLLRCGTLRQIEIEPSGVLRGLYLGGMRDSAEIRKLANERYGIQMGYGKCRLVDQAVMVSLGLDGYQLAKQGHEHELEEFERAGLFADSDDENVQYMYVRYKEGPGASDDAAVVAAGKLWGLSAAVGCWLADAIDTLEKYVPVYSDQDFDLSLYIEQNYPDLGVTRDDAVDLAFLSAIPADMEESLPDSSLRDFLQIDRKHDQCALESHLAYLASVAFAPMDLDHGQCTNIEFYDYMEKRLESFQPVR
jgi:AcrR family transcriptional regulator